MTTARRTRYGITFTLSLALSWTLATGLIALACWSGERTPERFASWAGLWIFTIGVPTLQALRVHRRLNELHAAAMIPERTRRDLAHTRFILLLCGSMVVLIVIGLLGAP